jgi:hypothetical protein
METDILYSTAECPSQWPKKGSGKAKRHSPVHEKYVMVK